MPFSTYLANELLDQVCKALAAPSIATLHFSLHTANPGPTGASEATGGSYARVAVTNGFSVAASGTTDNDSAITWPTLTASIGTATYWGMWDAASAGNFLGYGALTTSIVMNSGVTPTVPAGSLDLTFRTTV